MQSLSFQAYNFFFHPFEEKHSSLRSALSIITGIVLTILSKGAYLVVFGFIQWKDYKITVLNQKKVSTHKNFKQFLIDFAAKKNLPPTPKKLIKTIALDKNDAFDFRLEQSGLKTPSPQTNTKTAKTALTGSVKTPIQTRTFTQQKAKVSKTDLIKRKLTAQLRKFTVNATANKWGAIKSDHYDWWMFPVNHDSSAYQATFNVNKEEVALLKTDQHWIKDYKQGIELVVKAWGWDLLQQTPVLNPTKDQYWDGYGVRLAKMSDSLQLFEETDLHHKLKIFFVNFCLPQLPKIPISDLPWLKKSFGIT